MQDLLYVALMVLFVLVAWGFIVACDRILGPDEVALRAATRKQRDRDAESRRRAA